MAAINNNGKIVITGICGVFGSIAGIGPINGGVPVFVCWTVKDTVDSIFQRCSSAATSALSWTAAGLAGVATCLATTVLTCDPIPQSNDPVIIKTSMDSIVKVAQVSLTLMFFGGLVLKEFPPLSGYPPEAAAPRARDRDNNELP